MKLITLGTSRELHDALANVQNPDKPLEARLCLHSVEDGKLVSHWFPVQLVARGVIPEDELPGNKVVFKEGANGETGMLILTDSLIAFQSTIKGDDK